MNTPFFRCQIKKSCIETYHTADNLRLWKGQPICDTCYSEALRFFADAGVDDADPPAWIELPKYADEFTAALAAKEQAERERDEAIAKLRTCGTCDGDGFTELFFGYDHCGEELSEPGECPECKGTGVSSWGQAIQERDTLRARLTRADALLERMHGAMKGGYYSEGFHGLTGKCSLDNIYYQLGRDYAAYKEGK